MFDAISVSKTRKPWTVAVSFAGQGMLVGLAVLVPLVTTEALPHGHLASLLSSPEPPRGTSPRPPKAATGQRTATVVPVRSAVFQAPPQVPTKLVMVVDPAPQPDTGGPGVVGGTGDSSGGGNGVIAGLVQRMPIPDAPPVVVKEKARASANVPRIRRGGMVKAGKLIFGPQPVYPSLARQARIAGAVRLEAVIQRDGRISELHVVSGHPLLISAALEAVSRWVFQPTVLNGEPVEVATDIEVSFKLAQ